MDATATQLTDIKFNEAKRGYDPVEVDNFLEKLGDAVVKLQDKVREANRRADEAEQRAGDAAKLVVETEKRALDAEGRVAAGTGSADEHELGETLKKTLLLAQRTADDTVREATAEADKLMTEARQKAAKLLEDATRDSAKKLAAAEDAISERAEAETADLAEKVERLEVIRGRLANDVEALEKHVETVRAQVTASLQELLGVLDDPEKLGTPERPVMEAPAPRQPEAVTPAPKESDADSTAAYAIDLDGDGAADVVSDESSEPSPPVIPASARTTAATPGGSTPQEGAVASPRDPAPSTTPSPPGEASRTTSGTPAPDKQASMFSEPTKPPAPKGPKASIAETPTAPAAKPHTTSAAKRDDAPIAEAPGLEVSPAAGSISVMEGSPVEEASDVDDGFLDELRKAVDDEDPLGPLDDDADAAMRAFLAGDEMDEDDLPKRSRFGRKR